LSFELLQLETVQVARELLGHYLCHQTDKGLIKGVIVETEAYLSSNDPACHASRGMTRRNTVMFGPPGFAYVYFIYGNYHCFNVVTGPEGCGEAVLIRALEPLEGLDIMRSNRRNNIKDFELANGPGKLSIAFGINRSYNGHDLSKLPLYLEFNPTRGDITSDRTQRIGIKQGQEKLLRFVIKDHFCLSRR